MRKRTATITALFLGSSLLTACTLTGRGAPNALAARPLCLPKAGFETTWSDDDLRACKDLNDAIKRARAQALQGR